MKMLKHYSLFLAWLTSIVAVLATLYLGEVVKVPVCDLCWYQRICSYPLAIILGIACFRSFYGIARYTIPLALFGLVVSIHHYITQMFPSYAVLHVCNSSVPCNTIHFQWLGFITLPFLGVLHYILITFLLVLSHRHSEEDLNA